MKIQPKFIVPNVPMKLAPVCPNCKSIAILCDNAQIYGRNYSSNPKLGKGLVWVCPNRECRTYVGAHLVKSRSAEKYEPLGYMATKETHKARIGAHDIFDSLWKGENAIMTRSEAYNKLAEWMDISRELAHIGMFSKDQCNELKILILNFLENETEKGIPYL